MTINLLSVGHLFSTAILFLGLWTSSPAFAVPSSKQQKPRNEKILNRITDGNHTFRALPGSFSVPLLAKNNPQDLELVLFDFDLARALGITQSDQQRLKTVLEERLALINSKDGDRKVFATKYYNVERTGGDGRSVWLGEILFRLENGRIIYLDVQVKGGGTTPLHSADGLLTLIEAVHSYLTGKRNVQHNLDSTMDLAVFRYNKLKSVGSEKVISGLQVRIGNQTRPAHHGAHNDDVQNAKRMLAYVVRRNLGLPPGPSVTSAQVKKHLEFVVSNLAEEAGRYYDLHMVHGMLHGSNLQSSGGSIDFGTTVLLDGRHDQEGTNLRFETMVQVIYDGIGLREFSPGSYLNQGYVAPKKIVAEAFATDPFLGPLLRGPLSFEKMELLYQTVWKSTVTDLWLARLGLDQGQIERLKPATRGAFFDAVRALNEIKNGKTAAFDTHKILENSFRLIREGNDLSTLAGSSKLTATDRSWAFDASKHSLSAVQLNRLADFAKNIIVIAAELGPALNLSRAVERAESVLPDLRPETGKKYEDVFFTQEEADLYLRCEKGGFDYVENSRMARDIVNKMVHRNLPPRRYVSLTNLGALIRKERGNATIISSPWDKAHSPAPSLERSLEAAKLRNERRWTSWQSTSRSVPAACNYAFRRR